MADTMHKGQIIDIVAQGTGLTKLDTAAVIDGFLATVIWSLGNGESVSLRGFGTFRTAERSGRTVRNPQSGEQVWVEATRTVTFRPSKDLRAAVNQGFPELLPAPTTQA